MFLDHPAQSLAFVDGQRERFLAVDVDSGLRGVDGDLRVPVIGRGNEHDVDLLLLEHPAVVLVDLRRAAETRPGLLADVPIHVGDGHDVAVRPGFLGNYRTLVTQAHGGNPKAIVFRLRLVGLRGAGRERIGAARPAAAAPIVVARKCRRGVGKCSCVVS